METSMDVIATIDFNKEPLLRVNVSKYAQKVRKISM